MHGAQGAPYRLILPLKHTEEKKHEIIFPCNSVCFRGDNIFLWVLSYITSVILLAELPFQGAGLTTLRALIRSATGMNQGRVRRAHRKEVASC